MNKLIGLIRRNRFRVAAVIGVMFLVIGVSLLGYSLSAIQEREQLLNSADLTPDEMWQYEGSLSWWRNSYVTVFLPLTVIFVALGIVGLVSQPLWTRLHRKNVLETFADKVKRASKENYERPKLD
jgi:multisubunit Na+/H+ antiporter MnhG subunit